MMTLLIPGGMKASTPSGGDGLAIGEQLTMEERLNLRGGFTRLLKGTQADPTNGLEGVGVTLTTDRGYIFIPNNMDGDNTNFMEYCRDEDIFLLHPFKSGEGALSYDASTNSFTFHPDVDDEVRMHLRTSAVKHINLVLSRYGVPTVGVWPRSSGRLWSRLMEPSSSSTR